MLVMGRREVFCKERENGNLGMVRKNANFFFWVGGEVLDVARWERGVICLSCVDLKRSPNLETKLNTFE